MAIANPQKHLTDIDEWRRLGEAGIFPPDNRLELINGEILEMSPIGCNHAGHLNRILNRLLNIVPGDMAIASVQNPLQLGDLSEPEPDFMLLKPNTDFYSARHPDADDVLLLIEVSDSSLEFDRNQKMHLYALHRIPEYWLLNLNEACVEIYRKPAGDLYAEKRTLTAGDSIILSELPEIRVDIGDLL